MPECRDCGHIHRTGDQGLRCDAAQGRDVAALLRSFGVPREKWPAWVTADEIEEVLNDGG